jgi:hypothetical protein
MLSEKDRVAACELRQRAERRRWIARQITDKRAVEALYVVADKEARQAAEMEDRQPNESGATDLGWLAGSTAAM